MKILTYVAAIASKCRKIYNFDKKDYYEGTFDMRDIKAAHRRSRRARRRR